MKNIKDLLKTKKITQLGELTLIDPDAETIPEIFGEDNEIFMLEVNELIKHFGLSFFSGSDDSKATVCLKFLKDRKTNLKTANDYFMAGFMFSSAVILSQEAFGHTHPHEEHEEVSNEKLSN